MNRTQLEVGKEYAVFAGGTFSTRFKPDDLRTYAHRVIRGRLVSKDVKIPARGFKPSRKGLRFEAVERYQREARYEGVVTVEAGEQFTREDGRDVICPWHLYLQEVAKYDREKAERESAEQESLRRFLAVEEALRKVGVEVEEKGHIRLISRVTISLDDAEKLVAALP